MPSDLVYGSVWQVFTWFALAMVWGVLYSCSLVRWHCGLLWLQSTTESTSCKRATTTLMILPTALIWFASLPEQVLFFYIEDESQPVEDRRDVFEYFGNFTRCLQITCDACLWESAKSSVSAWETTETTLWQRTLSVVLFGWNKGTPCDPSRKCPWCVRILLCR